MYRRLFVLASLTLALAACVSAPASSAFNPASEYALVVLATPVGRSNNLDVLRRVDLATGRFVGPPIVVSVDTFVGLNSWMSAHNQINVDNTTRPVALALQEVPPGDYAWVESVRTAGSFSMGWTGILCLNEISPVFSVARGDIVILRVDSLSIVQTGDLRPHLRMNPNAPSNAIVLAEFERARTRFPDIVGTASIPEPREYIRWARTSGMSFNRNCREPESFERASQNP